MDPPATLNIHPAILRTNKNIHHEALPLLHSNTYGFKFLSPVRLARFLDVTAGIIGMDAARELLSRGDEKIPWTEGRVDQHTLKPLRHVEIRTSHWSLWSVDQGPKMRLSETGILLKDFLCHLIERLDDNQQYTTALQRTLAFRVVISGYDDLEYFLVKARSDNIGLGAEETVTLLEAVNSTRVDKIEMDVLSRYPKGRSILADWILSSVMDRTLR